MASNVFGSGGSIFQQQDPGIRNRALMAHLLSQQGASAAPVEHPLQAVARVVQGGIGGHMLGKEAAEFDARKSAATEAMTKALQAGQTAKPFTDPDTGQVAPGTMPANVMARMLMGNPDTAPMGMQMQMSQISNQQELQNALRLAREKQKLEPPKSRTVKRNGVEVTEQFDPATRTWTEIGQSGIGLVSPEAEEQKARIARAGATAINIDTKAKTAGATEAAKQGVPDKPLTPAQQAVDKSFADFYSEFVAQGGREDVNKNLIQLKGAINQLKSGKNLSGTFIGMIPEWALPMVNPDAANVKEMVSEVAQRNLRAVLGGQFAAKEGEALISRAYNSALDEKVNADRVSRLFDSIAKAMEAKMEAVDYFEKNGTLRGFTGKQWTMDDIEKAAGLDDKPAESGGSTIDDLLKKYGN